VYFGENVKRLKELRQTFGYTQEQLAEMLRTTPQSIARWETGKAEPSFSALRDLAMIFGTSVDDLVGGNPLSDSITTTAYTLLLNEKHDGCWGNAGVLLPGQQHTRWYPITSREHSRIKNSLDSKSGWLCFSTLNNRMVVMNAAKVKRVVFLDEACDQPFGDWEVGWDTVEGRPLELYRALEEYAVREDGQLEESASPQLISILEELVKENGWDEKTILKITTETNIWFADGSQMSYHVDEDDLWSLVSSVEIESDERMISLYDENTGMESFFSRDALALVEMPLLHVMDAARRELRELEEEDAQDKK